MVVNVWGYPITLGMAPFISIAHFKPVFWEDGEHDYCLTGQGTVNNFLVFLRDSRNWPL